MIQRAERRLKEKKRFIKNQEEEFRMELLKVEKEKVFLPRKPLGFCPEGKTVTHLGSGFWESSCFSHSLPTCLLRFGSTFTPCIQSHFLSPTCGPSCFTHFFLRIQLFQIC